MKIKCIIAVLLLSLNAYSTPQHTYPPKLDVEIHSLGRFKGFNNGNGTVYYSMLAQGNKNEIIKAWYFLRKDKENVIFVDKPFISENKEFYLLYYIVKSENLIYKTN